MKTLTLNEFNENYFKLSDDTMNAIKELEDITGKSVTFRLITTQEAIGFFKLKAKLARSFMDAHIIIINTDAVKDKADLNYHVVHEVMHGLRVFNAEPQERRVLSSNSAQNMKLKALLSEEISDFVKKSLNEFQLSGYLDNLIINSNLLLFNSSVDARIEVEIYDKYPSLRELQKKVLKDYSKEIIEGFTNKTIEATIPSWVSKRVRLMNYCYLLKISHIIGKSWTSKVNSKVDKEFNDTIERMMEYLNDKDKGQISDNKTINAWSEILDMKGYVSTIDFEDVPFNYEYTN